MAQQMYNLLVRQLDVEYLRFASRYRFHTAAYNPLAGGLLARPGLGEEPPPGSRFDGNSMYRGRYYSDVMRRHVEEYRALANELGISLATLAYAWLAARPGVDSVLVGPGSTAHLDAAIDGVRVALDPAVMARLDALHVAQQGSDAKYAR
jgi:aryl-alcohol dehydrogenase-like predicted oxidoreductase